MRKIRFAQASVSMIHANSYRDTLMLLPDEVELVGFYDPDPESVRKNLKGAAQNVPFYSSLAELLEKAKPDVVMVSTYLKDMPSWMLQVAEAGVNVWADKPFAIHSSELLPVAEAVKRNNLHFSCGYSWRFHPISQLIKESYDAGLLGKPYSIEFRFLTSSVARRNPDTWYMKRAEAGGGILNWLGCHWLDLMRYITSSEVSKVSAIEANVSGQPIDVEDAAAVSLQFDNGMIGSLHTGYFTSGDGEISFGLRGSDGWVKWEEADKSVTIKSTHPDWASAPRREFAVPTADVGGYGAEGMALIRQFAAAIRGEGSSGYTVEDAIRSLQIIEAAHESARTGQTISL
ncbi:MAG: Gfo/Idh/MocA family oxidoreductase [Caldilineaceae bacterium]|nr:Gfo/Idh/MocA family oxidoreductase [Caldilineaceae bacterium]